MLCVKMSYINILGYMSVTFDKSASKQNQARNEKHHLEDNALIRHQQVKIQSSTS